MDALSGHLNKFRGEIMLNAIINALKKIAHFLNNLPIDDGQVPAHHRLSNSVNVNGQPMVGGVDFSGRPFGSID